MVHADPNLKHKSQPKLDSFTPAQQVYDATGQTPRARGRHAHVPPGAHPGEFVRGGCAAVRAPGSEHQRRTGRLRMDGGGIQTRTAGK